MRFDNASEVETAVWDMRLSEQVRAADREVLLRLYDGKPPFSEETAEENGIQVNLNDLTGANVICNASRMWNSAHLRGTNFFTAKPDSGPAHKRSAWGISVTTRANRPLKRHPRMIGQVKATGKNTLLFGIGPTNWTTRRGIIPKPVPVGSLLIPDETEIEDLEDALSYYAIFREYNAEQLYDMTHGPRTDPGWNLPLVEAQWRYIKDELRKSPNSIAYQFMPERLEQLEKQSKGYLGSDAAPTCDVWDFYCKQSELGKGWYRRMIVDWYVGDQMVTYSKTGSRPQSKNDLGKGSEFLYTSGKRKYADSLGEILHCNFGDLSPYAPVKYHSLRGLGWMLWGVCELQNRLHCKFNEAVFESLMWYFQVAGNQDLVRLKKVNFEHMGVIPHGVRWLTTAERFTPNAPLVQMAFGRNQQLIDNASMSYTQSSDRNEQSREETATKTMAIVNAANALTSSVLDASYGQETFKYREMLRRLMLKNSNDPMARAFRLGVLQDGVPEEMLDVERWDVQPEQIVGGGNKTVQMATVNFLNQIRKNLPPDGQRLVDHISVEAATDQPDLAEEIAPIGEQTPISNSMHDAQLATDRLLRGLPYQPPKEAVFEDYVKVWLHDLAAEIQKGMAAGGMVPPDQLQGLQNFGKTIGDFIGEMARNEDEKEKVKEYEDAFGKLMNHVKAFEQRLQQALKAQQPKPGANGQSDGKREAALIMAKTKAEIAANSAAQRTAQKQRQWEMGETRKDLQTQSDIARQNVRTRHELLANRLKALAE